jgi:hypothetical protein
MLFKRQNGFIEVASAIKDAMLVRNAIVKVFVDQRTHRKTINKSNVAPEIVTGRVGPDREVKVHSYDERRGH